MSNQLGEFVRKQRGRSSLRTFAKKCDLSHTHLDSIERGYDPRTGKPVGITVEVLNKIAKALNMKVNELLIISGLVNDDAVVSEKLSDVVVQASKLNEKEITIVQNIIKNILESR